jgi:hypothetical protein
MMCAGVRALLVVRNDVVTGLITSYDIQGERPLQFLATAGCSRHDEIAVGHIMTPWERVPTIDWQTVSGARVSDIEAFFRHSPATHAVLVEPAGQGTFVRGVVSRARLERQLARAISRAKTAARPRNTDRQACPMLPPWQLSARRPTWMK